MLQEYRDHYVHKYDSPFACYVFETTSPQDCDEDASNPDAGGWVGRIGRRVMLEDSQGFCSVTRFEFEDTAHDTFEEIARTLDASYGIDLDSALGRLHLAIRDHSGMDDDEIRSAGEHGADAGWPGFTYTRDAVKFYDDNREDIFEVAQEMADEMGLSSVPALVASFTRAEMADSADGFANLLAWFALEEVGRSLDRG